MWFIPSSSAKKKQILVVFTKFLIHWYIILFYGIYNIIIIYIFSIFINIEPHGMCIISCILLVKYIINKNHIAGVYSVFCQGGDPKNIQ